MPQNTNEQLEKQAAADAALFNHITWPVLNEVAAARGYALKTQEDADAFLKVAAQVERQQTLKASAGNPVLKKAAASIGAPAQTADLDAIVTSLAATPVIRTALVAAR